MKHWYLLFFGSLLFAQNDSIKLLDQVKLYGSFSPKINAGYHLQILNDSVINKTSQSLGNLLQNQANIYFKQNGSAMVSSISLRGTGAANTGVYWNGIAINSSLNGQTDFNTLSANSFNQIEIRKGAGSVLFGSGAIGGAINLRDKVYFVYKKTLQINLGLASFNTQNVALKTRLSTTNFYTKIAFNGIKSNNNYKYLGTEIKNENAKFKNYHIKGILAYKINTKNKLQLFTNYSNNDRELSRTLVAPSNSKYLNNENRFLISWKNFGTNYNATLKLAYLTEQYQYFYNKETSNFSFGKSKNYIAKYDLDYFLKQNISFHTGLENKFIKGKGSNLVEKDQNILESFLLMHHEINNLFTYNISVRKGFSSTYKVPFIYALDAKFKINNKFSIKANYSTNYRLPTFNDLYWFASGNENLLPENSNSFELGFNYKKRKTKLYLNSYFTKSTDLIQWRPVTNSFWQPVNIQNVDSYGLELGCEITKNIDKHKLNFRWDYALTISTDKELNKQLIYVPFHKLNTNLTYNYKSWSANINQQYNGQVYITTSNTQTIEDFWLSNISLTKTLQKNKITVGLMANNIFNSKYQTVTFRPMPNRNYSINLILKF